MSHRRHTEFEIEQQIFLGGQISYKHEIFKSLALLSPNYVTAYVMLTKRKEILAQPTPMEILEKMLYYVGLSQNMQNYTELTRLSMILGDTRGHYSSKELKGELSRATQENPQP